MLEGGMRRPQPTDFKTNEEYIKALNKYADFLEERNKSLQKKLNMKK
jgi:uncharacterized C2H2 Zn-finger protein